jgi:hypothetical protein
MKYGVVLLPVLLALHGAVPVAAAPNAAPAKAKPATQKPAAATDGQPRVIEQRGKFAIRPDTLFCGAAKVDPKLKHILGTWSGPSINGGDLKQKLRGIGQSDYIGGQGRAGWSQAPKDCPDNGQNIFITGRTMMTGPVIYPYLKDDPRYPYSLELEARQGAGKNAAFVKVAVARADGYSPHYTPRVYDDPGPGPEFHIAGSIREDSKILSAKLINQIFPKQE